MSNIDTLLLLIKNLSADFRYGSALIELMDYYNVTRLSDISEEQAEIFYMLYENIHKEF